MPNILDYWVGKTAPWQDGKTGACLKVEDNLAKKRKEKWSTNDGGGLGKWNHWRKHIHGGCATKYSQVRGYHNHRP